MGSFCIVCKKKREYLTYHKFPACPELRSVWLKQFNLEEDDIFKTTVVCEDHFEKSCYAKTMTGKPSLKRGSFPTLRLGGKTLKVQDSSTIVTETDPKPKKSFTTSMKLKNGIVVNVVTVDDKSLDFGYTTSSDILNMPNGNSTHNAKTLTANRTSIGIQTENVKENPLGMPLSKCKRPLRRKTIMHLKRELCYAIRDNLRLMRHVKRLTDLLRQSRKQKCSNNKSKSHVRQ